MRKTSEHKYLRVADAIERLIDTGILRAGDKLTSVRGLSKERGISLSTAFKAYYFLESKGLVEARPQSGYYVRFTPKSLPALPKTGDLPEDAVPASQDEAIANVYAELESPRLLNFALAVPANPLMPGAKLNKAVVEALRASTSNCLHYEEVQGNEDLRKQVARILFNWGGVFTEDDVVVTAGCMEAMAFCLKAITRRGDAVAIESPTYFGIFQVMESLGLNIVEVPTDPMSGVDLESLQEAIDRFDIKACLFVTNFNNPLGSLMPESRKKALVELLAQRNIPLIEDDIYGELYFGDHRPRTCKSFDRKGLVLYCSSFSKTLAPGYRVGYTLPGRFKKEVMQLKRMHTISTNTLAQSAIAFFLARGRYELHLRHLRRSLHTQVLRYTQAICEYFPEGTRITRPQGGFVVWIELHRGVDTFRLHKKALQHQIGIAPGQIFSSNSQFKNCFRISCGEPWSERVDQGLKTLARLASGR